jgi:hypothetical protein
MNRRSFAQGLGGAAMASAITSARSCAATPEQRSISLYRLEYLYLRQERARVAVHNFLASQSALLGRYARMLGLFTAVTGPRIPATLILSGFTSFEDMETSDALIRRDAGYRHALEAMEKVAGPPYERATMLLRPALYSSEISNSRLILHHPRLFELRLYHSASEVQLRSLHERLAKPRGIFSRADIRPLLQAETVAGPNLPNLAYLIPFVSLAERENAWTTAATDAEWNAAHESAAQANQIVADISLLQPTPFSPMQ